MDDRKGYEEAVRRNLQAVGTLGVLAEAASQQPIDLPQVLTPSFLRTIPSAIEKLYDFSRRFLG